MPTRSSLLPQYRARSPTLLLAELVDCEESCAGMNRSSRPIRLSNSATRLVPTKRRSHIWFVRAPSFLASKTSGPISFWKQTPATIMQLVGNLQPTSRFGEGFEYSNLTQAAAGYVAGSVAEPGKELGAAYDEAMEQHGVATIRDEAQRSRLRPALMQKATTRWPHDVDFDGRIVAQPVWVELWQCHCSPPSWGLMD